MRAVLQRVTSAKVTVSDQIVSQIGPGWLVLLGVGAGDNLSALSYLVEKTAHLRGFPDAAGKMNLSILDTAGEVLVVSQFTLFGDCRKGRRPSFEAAAKPADADDMYQKYCAQLRQLGIRVAMGVFQAHMLVELVNDGPVTFVLDSTKVI